VKRRKPEPAWWVWQEPLLFMLRVIHYEEAILPTNEPARLSISCKAGLFVITICIPD
jgi:hypothetical protein